MIENADIVELEERYKFLLQKYAELATELASKMDKFGKYRQELLVLTNEFSRRGVKIDDPEGLKKFIEEELLKRQEAKKDVQTTT